MGLLPAETASLNSINKRMDQIERRISYAFGIMTLAGGVAVAAVAGVIASMAFKALGGP